MAVGDTLATLVEEVQYELSHVVTPAVGQNFRDHIKNRIRREYRRLYHDFNWRHLRRWTDLQIAAGQRYYDYPEGASVETITAVYVKWSGRFHPINDDLTVIDYNSHNSDDDVRVDPIQKWRPYGADQLEVWPLPASAVSLRFEMKAPFEQMTEESDTCALDTDMVVLFVASELARRSDDKEAALLLARAQQHYDTLKLRSRGASKPVNLAGGGATPGRDIGFGGKTIIGVERG